MGVYTKKDKSCCISKCQKVPSSVLCYFHFFSLTQMRQDLIETTPLVIQYKMILLGTCIHQVQRREEFRNRNGRKGKERDGSGERRKVKGKI